MQTEFKAYIQAVQKTDYGNVQETRVVLDITGPHDRARLMELMMLTTPVLVSIDGRESKPSMPQIVQQNAD